LCNGCLICGEVCTAKAIRFPNRILGAQPPLKRTATSEHQRSLAQPVWAGDGTPYVLPWETACSVCLSCGPACPTGALQPIEDQRDQIKRRVRMGVARLDRKVCLPWTRVSWCGACLTICPFRGEAITVDYQSRPTIHPEHCIGCGLCVEVCPIRHKAVAVIPPFYPDHGRVRVE
jgi:ferredoxin